MALQIAEFWKLTEESHLLSSEDVQRWTNAFGQVKGASKQGNAATLSEWLISEKAITRYHATILMAGRPGPFVYGDYKVLDRISKGRLAGLFRAVHVPSGQPVSLSFLTGESTQDLQALAYAQQQVQLARHAAHPALSRCYELVDLGSFKFVVLEALAGETLEDRLAPRGPLTPVESCRLARLIMLALARLHELGLTHGDVRPGNIWLTRDGQAKLLQIPLSHDPLTEIGPLDFAELEAQGRIGTLADYWAPELAQVDRAPDAVSDIYALGCTLYHMIAGQPPFAGGDWRQKIVRHASEPIQPLTAAGVPPQLAQVIAYLMAKDPNVRYRQAAQAAEAIGFFIDPAAQALPQENPSPTLVAYEAHLNQPVAAAALAMTSAATALPMSPVAIPLVENGLAIPATFGPYAQAAALSQNGTAAYPTPAGVTALNYGATTPRVAPVKNNSLKLLIFGGLALVVGLIAALLITFRTKRPTDSVPIAANSPTKTPSPAATTNPYEKTPSGVAESGSTPIGGAEKPPKTNPPNTGGSTTGSGTASGSKPTEIEDDGQSLWAVPTTGRPIELRYVANDTPLFFILRPADLMTHPNGDRLWSAFGPTADGCRNQLTAISGLQFTDIQQLIVALYDKPGAPPSVSLVIRLRKKIERDQLVKGWGNTSEADYNGQRYFEGGSWGYYLPPSDNDMTIVMADVERLKKIIDNGSKPPDIDIKLERMLVDTDASRHFTLVFNPAYLTGDGKGSVFRGLFAPLQGAVEELLATSSRAGSVSIHLGNHFFWELRLTSDGADAQLMARSVNERIAKLSKEVRKVVSTSTIHPWAKMAVDELPDALGKMSDFTRAGVDNEQAVVRCLLPVNAGQHLFMGAELLLAHKAGPSATGPATVANESVADKLKKKVSLVFVRDTLEKSMQMLQDALGVPIEILGSDLQLEGITKNQSFGMDEKELPARDILQKIMKLANPEGKLIYVIKPKQKDGPDMIFITTRASAAKRKDTLPSELELPK